MTHTLLGVVVLGAALAGGQTGATVDDAAPVAGVWRGTSECMVKSSPCQDETNVYRIEKLAGRSNRYSVTGSKIVDGKEVVMGPASNWDYDPVNHTLTFAVGNGHFRLKVDGDKMDGELMLADMTIYRRIHLQRAKE
jgi:hypothetical protein